MSKNNTYHHKANQVNLINFTKPGCIAYENYKNY